jgi:uncharacterized membrane protein HdeD (DUF308 family)
MHELSVATDALRYGIRKMWWVPLIQGLAAMVIGVLLLTRPAPTLLLLTVFLGAYWLVGGAFDAVAALTRRNSDRHWVLSLISSLLSILVGLLLLGQPILGFVLTSMAVVALIAVCAVVSGILSVIWAVRVRREIHGEGWIILIGVLSILLGLVLLASPLISALLLIQLAALLAIAGGVAAIISAFRLRRVVA